MTVVFGRVRESCEFESQKEDSQEQTAST